MRWERNVGKRRKEMKVQNGQSYGIENIRELLSLEAVGRE
jgi:hypothetical protein